MSYSQLSTVRSRKYSTVQTRSVCLSLRTPPENFHLGTKGSSCCKPVAKKAKTAHARSVRSSQRRSKSTATAASTQYSEGYSKGQVNIGWRGGGWHKKGIPLIRSHSVLIAQIRSHRKVAVQTVTCCVSPNTGTHNLICGPSLCYCCCCCLDPPRRTKLVHEILAFPQALPHPIAFAAVPAPQPLQQHEGHRQRTARSKPCCGPSQCHGNGTCG